MRFDWNPDPVERVFGIVMAGGMIVVFVLTFFGPGEILGRTRIYYIVVLVIGIYGIALGLQVVRWFRKRDE